MSLAGTLKDGNGKVLEHSSKSLWSFSVSVIAGLTRNPEARQRVI
jgi:hypothetical protein